MCIRKVNTSFFYTFWTQTQLILPRIYSLVQQKSYKKNNAWSWKSADTAKTSSNFEKKLQNINPR